MRGAPALLLLVVAAAPAGGCVSGNRGAVLLHLNQRSAELFLAPTFSSTSAGVGPTESDFLFTATSNQGALHVLLAKPIHAGDTIALPTGEQRVRFDFADAEWSNEGGTIYVISEVPPIIGLIAVPMMPRSAAAAGSFVFDGNGTFVCAGGSFDARCVAGAE
jgi:hypothetical protein